jgi:hypothetical protein
MTTNNSREKVPFVHSPLGWILGITIFIISIAGSMNMALMLIDREPPIIYIERKANNKEVPQGGVLSLTYTIERNRLCSSVLNRWIVDSQQIRHIVAAYTQSPLVSNQGIALGRVTETREITVPVAVAEGPAIQYLEAMYYCNTLQRIFDWPIIVRSPDIRFTVVKGNVPQSTDADGKVPTGVNDQLDLNHQDLQNIRKLRWMMPALYQRYASEVLK